MAKLIVLGAGKLQVPIIQHLKRNGHEVIVISPKGDYPGFDFSDKAYYLDVREKEKITEIARKENIEGILTDQTDLPVTTMAFVARELNLPGIEYEVSRLYTRKSMMHEKCIELGIDVPGSVMVSSITDAVDAAAKIGYPIIIKPPDNQGSRGVYKISSPESLRELFPDSISYSSDNKVLVEEFIEGMEYAVLGIAYKNKFWNLLCFEQYNFNHPRAIAFNYAVHPPVSGSLKNRIYEINSKLMKGFGLSQGLTETEFIYSEIRDKFYLIETAARGAGAYKTSHLIPKACNINTQKFLSDLALGNRVDTSGFRESMTAVGFIAFYLRGGKIEHISGLDEVLSMQEVLIFPHEKLKIGYLYPGLKDKSYRLGPIALAADNRDQLVETIQRIKKVLVIATEGGGGIVWD